MSVASISRNASCPCGSGKKYMRCCLVGEENAVRDALFDAAVGRRIQEWAAELFDDELDEPHPLLAGRSPRDAAGGPARAEVVRLIRQLENGAERARRRGEPAADVARLRRELELSDEFAA